MQLARFVGATDPVVIGFVGFRIAQNVAIFAFAARYYRLLGFGLEKLVLSLSILAWALTNSLYGADLSLSIYSDVLLYLLAAVVILRADHLWILPITALAAANRETSFLIPVLLLAYARRCMPRGSESRRSTAIAVVSMALWVLIFGALLVAYRTNPVEPLPYGFRLALQNLKNPTTWLEVAATFGVLPVLCALAPRAWPPVLRAWVWAVVPVWLVFHLMFAVIAQTSVLLVPLTAVVLPGALMGWEKRVRSTRVGSDLQEVGAQ